MYRYKFTWSCKDIPLRDFLWLGLTEAGFVVWAGVDRIAKLILEKGRF